MDSAGTQIPGSGTTLWYNEIVHSLLLLLLQMEFNKYLVPALDPVSVVVWGEKAMGFLGVKLVLNVGGSLPSFHARAKVQS